MNGCFVELAIDIVGGKWKGIILYHLLDGPKRFNQLRRLIPTVTQRMLTLQLRELEEDGVISRIQYPEIPPHVEYQYTEFGKTLQPIIQHMQEWGKLYTEEYFADNQS
ncbi:ArsR family transcriptional regulator [Vagococcus humatus]|uniref:ArsR family transcriptional regulator n=2 Tax=Vagococcus humatus TaxID=1889241 RepID=A0A3S0GD70_9ENTE|nr:helix-turn-helix domain-containing protein [Vagococcus humatus]RST89142.1 ArsR family transcriptional regulator [Vagococcus humatus]